MDKTKTLVTKSDFCGVLLLARLWYHCSQWRFLRQCWLPCVIALIQTVVIRFANAFPRSPTVLLTRVPCSVSVEPTSTTLSTLHWRDIHILAKLFRWCLLPLFPLILVVVALASLGLGGFPCSCSGGGLCALWWW